MRKPVIRTLVEHEARGPRTGSDGIESHRYPGATASSGDQTPGRSSPPWVPEAANEDADGRTDRERSESWPVSTRQRADDQG